MLVVPGSQQIKKEAEALGSRQDISGVRRGVAGIRMLYVPWHERRHRAQRTTERLAPVTGISRVARVSVHVQYWPAR